MLNVQRERTVDVQLKIQLLYTSFTPCFNIVCSLVSQYAVFYLCGRQIQNR